MSIQNAPGVVDRDHGDQLALRMMLSYVEAECLRIGANDAARHAAMAASLMPRPASADQRRIPLGPQRGQSLH